MSWKLAELRWRQDIGLNEGTLTRAFEPSQHEPMLHKSTDAPGPGKRARSYTAPWGRVVVESNLDDAPANSTISPQPMSQSLPSGLSDSSSIPLLVAIQDHKGTPELNYTTVTHSARCLDRSRMSLQPIHTPSRFVPLRRKDVPDAQFDGIQRVRLAQAGNATP